jgi:hypothetical protein
MRDDDSRPVGRAADEAEERAAVERLLAEAGPRPPLDDEDVALLAAATRQGLRERFPGARPSAVVRPTRTPAVPAAPRSVPRWLPLAALLALALGVAAWWAVSQRVAAPPVVARVEAVAGRLAVGEGGGRPLAAGAEVARGALLCTDRGSHATLRLDGGSELRVAGASCLRAAAGDRVALVRGALYADTGGAAALTVDTPFGSVHDIGTRFAVRLLDEAVAVAVREGAVLVAGEHRAGAGEGLVVRRGRVERRQVPAWGEEWAWVVEAAPGFEIEGRTLAEFLAWTARETGWRVRWADPALAAEAGGILLHGDLGPLRPDEAPFAVLPGAGLDGRLEGGVLVVSRR